MSYPSKIYSRLSPGILLVVLCVACAPAGDPDAATDAAPDATAEAAPLSPAEALIARSIAFHDRDGVWGRGTLSLAWNGTDPGGEERVSLDMTLYPDGSTFSMTGRYRGHEIAYATTAGELSVAVDGSAEIPQAIAEAMRLQREDGFFWRSYFGFLVGLPMKLRDPGTRIDPDPRRDEFMGRPVDVVRVTYDADVGGDTWYFYFVPETAELIGSRFYHDESANDGEYIVFEGLAEFDGLRLPARRSWYVNADDRFLGEDEISELAVSR